MPNTYNNQPYINTIMQIIVALRVNAIPSKKTPQKEKHKQRRGHPLFVRLKN